MTSETIKQEVMDTTSDGQELTDDCNKDNNNNSDNEDNDNELSGDRQPMDRTASGGSSMGRSVRRGRRMRRIGAKVDVRAKLERSRQSARECRARKKLRYQYLEDLVIKRETANIALKHELNLYREIFKKIESGHKPQELLAAIDDDKQRKHNRRA